MLMSTCAQQVLTEGRAASSLEWHGVERQVACCWLSLAAGRRLVAPRGGASWGRGVPSLGTGPLPRPQARRTAAPGGWAGCSGYPHCTQRPVPPSPHL